MRVLKRKNLRRLQGVHIPLLLILTTVIGTALSAQPTKVTSKNEISVDLTKAKGRIIGQKKFKEPIGHLNIKGWTVERIDLAQPLTVETNGKTKSIKTAYRLKVSGGPFNVGALIWHICVNNTPVVAVESEDLSALSAIIFDKSLLQNSKVAVVYGNPDVSCSAAEGTFAVLPEKINLDKGHK